MAGPPKPPMRPKPPIAATGFDTPTQHAARSRPQSITPRIGRGIVVLVRMANSPA